MNILFRLKHSVQFFGVPPLEKGLLGYEWLEVLAITPVALAKPDENWGEWCAYRFVNDYVCLTPDGLAFIRESDVQSAIEKGELELDIPH